MNDDRSTGVAEQDHVNCADCSYSRSLHHYFDRLPTPMVVTVLDTARLSYVNKAFSDISGYQPKEVIGRTAREIGLWYNIADRRKAVEQLLTAGVMQGFVTDIRAKNGDKLQMVVYADFTELNGRECIVWNGLDLTLVKKYEQEQARLDSLHLIGEMAASIAQEIRNPMTIAKGYLQFLAKRTPADLQERYDVVYKELQHIETMVANFLVFTRTQSAEKTTVDFNQAITDLAPLIIADATQNDIFVNLKLDQDLPAYWSNKNQIMQVILNLCRNAIESMGKRGILTIRTEARRSGVAVIITDTGKGIAEKDLGSIFKAFYTTKTNGTGLGLAIVERIVKDHKGKISVKSKEGLGTTFTLLFPVN